MKKREQKPKRSKLGKLWQRIVRNTSGQGSRIGIPDKQDSKLIRRGR